MFQSLDKVVCIRPGDPANGLVKGQHYTVYNCFVDASGSEAVELIEIDPPTPHIGFLSFRFEKLIEDGVLVNKLEETINK